MEQEGRDAEALRRRLYRPGASAEDLDSYLDAAEPLRTATHDSASRPARPAAGPRRRLRLVAAGSAVAMVLAGAVAVGALARSPSTGPVASATRSTASQRPVGRRASAILDGGSRPHATGRAEQEDPHGILYTVARGDTVLAIAERFGLCAADVYGALPYGADTARLPPEQRLLLEDHALEPAEYALPGAC